MLASVLAQTNGFDRPTIDYHAFAPEIVLVGALVLVLVVDLLLDERSKGITPIIAGLGLLGAFVPILTLGLDGADRLMFDGAYVVDDFALVMKGLFLLTGYIVILISTQYITDGDYYEGEYYFLLLSSLLGMVVMSSARDLITIFVALELLSIPAYMLAGWRKRDTRSNEAALKYYLLGVLASGVMLYGMSLIYGAAGTTVLVDIAARLGELRDIPLLSVGVVFILVGFGFKVSAVPFHQWAPDTYEGAPTPVAAFLSVASKAAGFVALLQLVFLGFFGQREVWGPFFWIIAAATMTVGNLIALRQTNAVRLLAYSSVAQAGFMLVPLAVAAERDGVAADSALTAVVTYLLIYAAMNLGAFGTIIAIARKTRTAEISSFGGLFSYAPGLTLLMTIFLFSLAGIPPLGGWIAKFVVFRAVADAGTTSAWILGVIVAVNAVVALFYYANIAREMWFNPVPDGDTTPIAVPPSLALGLGLTVVGVLAVGVFPSIVTHFGELATFTVAVP
ncbi:MAG TPA: NADH-quinone oxidoreductase subunit N [Acidimicrobiales bacterium]